MPFYQRRCRSTVGVRSWRLAMTLKKEIRVVVCVRQTADLVQEQQPRRRSVKEALIKPSDSPVLSRVQGLRTHGNLLIPRKWFFSIPLLPAKVARKINSLGIRRRRYDRFVTVLARELDAFLDATPEATLRFVSFYDSEDLEVTVDVIGRMRHQDRITPPEPRLTSHDYVAMARDARVVFGMRLHSLILASVAGTPFAAVDYSPKVGAFARQMGQDAYAEPVTAFAEGTLARAFTRAWADAHANAPVIARHHDAFAESNRQAFARIQELLDQAG